MNATKLQLTHTKIPFSRVTFYQTVHYPPHTKVYVVVKKRDDCILHPTFHDTFFYTIPVRKKHESTCDNSVLAFLCESQAMKYTDAMNNEKDYLINNKEPNAICQVDQYSIADISYYAHCMCTQLCVICNSYCEGQIEPSFTIMLANKPLWNS